MAELNGTMMQYFHWYVKPQDDLWNRVAAEARNLAAAGIAAIFQ